MKILSLDPGTVNFGFSATSFVNGKVTITRCGMIDETIKEIKDAAPLQHDALLYVRRIAWLLSKSKATHVGAERYVPRRQGLSNESVNQMLGTCVSYAATLGIPCSLYLAATWKIRLKKVLDLEALYKECHPIPDHVIDAVFIGLFTAEKLGAYSLDKLKTPRQQKILCKQIKQRFIDLRSKLSPKSHAAKAKVLALASRKSKRKAATAAVKRKRS